MFGSMFRPRSITGNGIVAGDQQPWERTVPGFPSQTMPGSVGPEVLNPAKRPGAFSQGGKAWQIMGIIGDAMQAASGGSPTYLPAVLDLQKQTEEERRFQQKLAAETEQARLKAQEPPQMIQNWQAYEGLPDDQKQRFASYYDIIQPRVATGADGLPYPVPRAAAAPSGGLPQGYDPKEWEVVPSPQASVPSGNPLTARPPSEVISQYEFSQLRQRMGDAKASEYIRSRNIEVR